MFRQVTYYTSHRTVLKSGQSLVLKNIYAIDEFKKRSLHLSIVTQQSKYVAMFFSLFTSYSSLLLYLLLFTYFIYFFILLFYLHYNLL